MSRGPALANLVRSSLPGDVAGFDSDAVAGVLSEIKAARGVLDAFEAKVTSHARQLHERGESVPAADLHTRDGGVSSRDAKAKERRSEALEQAPSLADQLDAGAITSAHADALADASARIDDEVRNDLFEREADLAADATRMTPEEFAKNCRDLVARLERERGVSRDEQRRQQTRLTKKVDQQGMYLLSARMHPELGSIVFNAIDAETAALVKAGGDRSVDRATVAADALGNLVTSGHQAARPAEAEIRVLVDADTLIDGAHHDTTSEYVDGTPASPTDVQRFACNGRIVPIVIDSRGVVMNAGRAQRLANRHQRRALQAMYRTCAFSGCDVPFDRCEIHHLNPWEHGGLTNLHEMIPACARHHHVVHEYGLQLVLDEHRTLTITQPDGTVFAVVPLRSATATTLSDESHPERADRTEPSPIRPTARPPGADPPPAPDQLELIA